METKTRPFLYCLLILACWSTRTLGDEEGQEVQGPLPWHVQDGDVFLRRVVSAATGQPIPHATVKLYAEVPHPVPGTRQPTASGRGDANGWVRIRRDALDPELLQHYGDPTWAYVEAPGYGPNAVYASDRLDPDRDLELRPASELRVKLRDPTGRPIEGARVGWLLGCGHTPDVREAATDGTGTARLVGVQDHGYGQIWPVKTGFRSWYVTDDAWRPWERPRLAELGWGTVVEGRVLRHDGTPAVGVAVGSPEGHRGPWALTDERGHFLLRGTALRPGESFRVEPFEYPVNPKGPPQEPLMYGTPLPGHEVVITLPPPGEGVRREPWVPLEIDVALEDWGSEEGVHVAFAIVACRTADGWTRDAFAMRGEDASIEVPVGAYDVEVSVEVSGIICSRARTRATVTEAGGRARVVLPQPAAVTLTHPDSDAVIRLISGREDYLLSDEDGEQVIFVPPADPLFLRVDQPGRTRIVPIDLVTGGPRDEPLHVAIPVADVVSVSAKLVNEAGKTVEGWLAEMEDGRWVKDDDFQRRSLPSSRPSTQALAGADVLFVAWPKDEILYQPVLVDVRMLTSDNSNEVDLGTVRIPSRRPHLQVVDAAGEVIPNPDVIVTHGPRQEELSPELWGSGRIFDPWASPGLLVEGAIVRTEAFDMPVIQTLRGQGPWTLCPPAGRLTVAVTIEGAEEPVSFKVCLDGRFFGTEDGELAVDALAAGEHEAIVDVPGHPPRRLVFTIGDGESRSWSMRIR